MTHSVLRKPALQGLGSVPGGSAECNCQVYSAMALEARILVEIMHPIEYGAPRAKPVVFCVGG